MDKWTGGKKRGACHPPTHTTPAPRVLPTCWKGHPNGKVKWEGWVASPGTYGIKYSLAFGRWNWVVAMGFLDRSWWKVGPWHMLSSQADMGWLWLQVACGGVQQCQIMFLDGSWLGLCYPPICMGYPGGKFWGHFQSSSKPEHILSSSGHFCVWSRTVLSSWAVEQRSFQSWTACVMIPCSSRQP